MKNSFESKFFLILAVLTIVVISVGIFKISFWETSPKKDDFLPDGVQTKGGGKSGLYLVEFSDFQCPACKTAADIVNEVVKLKGEDLIFGYRHFPLDQHKFAFKAALGAEAAGKQGKFWEMHDFLFKNQTEISEEKIFEGAMEIGLDMDTFQKDFESEELAGKIYKDINDGKRLRLTGTPTFYLNGKKIFFSTKEDLLRIIDNQLK